MGLSACCQHFSPCILPRQPYKMLKNIGKSIKPCGTLSEVFGSCYNNLLWVQPEGKDLTCVRGFVPLHLLEDAPEIFCGK